ncbi:SDR family NAD(P)-dependent oxidoreductase [Microbacterium sp. STN6]|uniref:SDR family NAD(P)-dependent oxidoreductase n=1 Tax=Microbacterium sp. STN6 TaxID=2995588 RepID=UPI002260D864|nr:SDR family NAD(P)-dependent oxidoreductase [Microbacterium sp. STN6]MCX7521470.1 SDR family NAD(P)-dependent oxidoreductase [Microbacterium sp. STN6]
MTNETNTALIVGASRGLGLAIVEELAKRGWRVIGTVRDLAAATPLHEAAARSGGRITVEELDITKPEQLPPLHERLAGGVGSELAILFVNAGTTNNEETPIGSVPTSDFIDVMVTNALSPMRVIEALQDLVPSDGLIGAMTSGQGSITNNTRGSREVYRGSKAALNQFMRSFAVRQADTDRAMLLMAPGWIKTALGGDDAPFTIDENVPKIVDVMLAKRSVPGLEYLDFRGTTVPW